MLLQTDNFQQQYNYENNHHQFNQSENCQQQYNCQDNQYKFNQPENFQQKYNFENLFFQPEKVISKT